MNEVYKKQDTVYSGLRLMNAFRRYLPRKVEFARDAIVRCIHDRHLEVGDRLPSYSQLRAEFGLGSQTIAAAVGSLCELGVLEVRDKVGIFVKNPAGGHLAGRTIAVVVRPLDGSAYSAQLASFIQKLISEHNCRCLAFYRRQRPDAASRPGFDEFPGLEQAVDEHRIDGIITMCPFSDAALRRLDRNNIKCCFIGDDDHHGTMPCGVVIEVRHFLLDALDALRKVGCRRVIQLCTDAEQFELRRSVMPARIGRGYDGGAAIARELLALPPEQRPEGIVSDDDTVVSGLLAELRTADPDDAPCGYLPIIATIVHREVGERYPSRRMLLFTQDIEEYAGLAVELLLQLLQGKRVGNSHLVYRFKPVGAAAENAAHPELETKISHQPTTTRRKQNG